MPRREDVMAVEDAMDYSYGTYLRLIAAYLDKEERITVDFSGTPTTGSAPLTVQFTSAVTGPIVDYAWDFTQGQVGFESNDPNPEYTFIAPGTYTVAMYCRDALGLITAEVKPLYITVNP